MTYYPQTTKAPDVYTYVPVGTALIPFTQLERYVLHNLESHDDDIMGWDLLHAALHNNMISTAGNQWSDECDRALEKLVDILSSCPVCHKVPLFSSKWYCTDCQRQITKRDVIATLGNYRMVYGMDMTMEEYRVVAHGGVQDE